MVSHNMFQYMLSFLEFAVMINLPCLYVFFEWTESIMQSLYVPACLPAHMHFPDYLMDLAQKIHSKICLPNLILVYNGPL